MRRQAWLALAAISVAACSSPSTSSGTPAAASSTASTTTSVTLPTTTTAPSTLPPTTPAPTTTSAEQALAACVGSWPLRAQVARLVWPSVYSADWPAAIAAVHDLGLGGVILMKPSDTFAAALGAHLGELDAASTQGVLVATDEEGGAVQRLSALGVLPSQEAMSTKTPAQRRTILDAHAAVVAAAGIDVALAPVVDVRPAQGDDPLGEGRLFLGTPDDVTALAREYVEAWERAGVLPVLKHFPGHGSASADTHKSLAVTPPIDQLRTRDLQPYVALVDSGAAVMVGHLDVPGLTDGQPASLSRAAVDLLRTELGWGDALVMTDALGMGAVGRPLEQAAIEALVAGDDVVLFTDTASATSVIDALVAAVEAGTIPAAQVTASAVKVQRLIATHGTACTPG